MLTLRSQQLKMSADSLGIWSMNGESWAQAITGSCIVFCIFKKKKKNHPSPAASSACLAVFMDPLLNIVHPSSFMEPSSEDFLEASQFPSASFTYQITRTLLHGLMTLTCKPLLFSWMWQRIKNQEGGAWCSDCLLTGKPCCFCSTDPGGVSFANYSQDRQGCVGFCLRTSTH